MALLDLTANYSRNPLPIPSPDLKGNSSTSWKKQPASQTVTGSINIETLREGFITESDSLLDKPITDVKETVSIGRSSIKLLGKKTIKMKMAK